MSGTEQQYHLVLDIDKTMHKSQAYRIYAVLLTQDVLSINAIPEEFIGDLIQDLDPALLLFRGFTLADLERYLRYETSRDHGRKLPSKLNKKVSQFVYHTVCSPFNESGKLYQDMIALCLSYHHLFDWTGGSWIKIIPQDYLFEVIKHQFINSNVHNKIRMLHELKNRHLIHDHPNTPNIKFPHGFEMLCEFIRFEELTSFIFSSNAVGKKCPFNSSKFKDAWASAEILST